MFRLSKILDNNNSFFFEMISLSSSFIAGENKMILSLDLFSKYFMHKELKICFRLISVFFIYFKLNLKIFWLVNKKKFF